MVNVLYDLPPDEPLVDSVVVVVELSIDLVGLSASLPPAPFIMDIPLLAATPTSFL